jgi:hypothetical protein
VKLLVFGGGKDFADRAAVFSALDKVDAKRTIYLIVEGGEPSGVDAFAREWAAERGAVWLEFPVRGSSLTAAPARNTDMVMMAGPDGAVQFPGGEHADDLRRRCNAAGVKVWEPLAEK